MRRTKQWWTGLTKEERSELHHLERANSNWSQRKFRTRTECSYCKGSCGAHDDQNWLCSKCFSRRCCLIQKANEAIYFAEVVKTNCAN